MTYPKTASTQYSDYKGTIAVDGTEDFKGKIGYGVVFQRFLEEKGYDLKKILLEKFVSTLKKSMGRQQEKCF